MLIKLLNFLAIQRTEPLATTRLLIKKCVHDKSTADDKTSGVWITKYDLQNILAFETASKETGTRWFLSIEKAQCSKNTQVIKLLFFV